MTSIEDLGLGALGADAMVLDQVVVDPEALEELVARERRKERREREREQRKRQAERERRLLQRLDQITYPQRSVRDFLLKSNRGIDRDDLPERQSLEMRRASMNRQCDLMAHLLGLVRLEVRRLDTAIAPDDASTSQRERALEYLEGQQKSLQSHLIEEPGVVGRFGMRTPQQDTLAALVKRYDALQTEAMAPRSASFAMHRSAKYEEQLAEVRSFDDSAARREATSDDQQQMQYEMRLDRTDSAGENPFVASVRSLQRLCYAHFTLGFWRYERMGRVIVSSSVVKSAANQAADQDVGTSLDLVGERAKGGASIVSLRLDQRLTEEIEGAFMYPRGTEGDGHVEITNIVAVRTPGDYLRMLQRADV